MRLQRALWALSVSAAFHVAVIGWGGRIFQPDAGEPVARRVETRFRLSPPPPPLPPPAPPEMKRPALPNPPTRRRPTPPIPRHEELTTARTEPERPPLEEPVVAAEPEANPPAPGVPAVAEAPQEAPRSPNPPEEDPLQFPETRPDYSGLVSAVRGGIDGAKRYPLLARRAGYEGRVLLKFKVLKSGAVEELRVLEPSHFEILDEAAMEAVRRAAPFPDQGRQIDGDYIEIILPVVFRLHQP